MHDLELNIKRKKKEIFNTFINIKIENLIASALLKELSRNEKYLRTKKNYENLN
jgi:hypothetical protein